MLIFVCCVLCVMCLQCVGRGGRTGVGTEIERRRKIERATHFGSTLACLLAIRSEMILDPATAVGLGKRAFWKMKSFFIQYHQVALKPLALRVLPVLSDLSPDFDSKVVRTIFKVPSSM